MDKKIKKIKPEMEYPDCMGLNSLQNLKDNPFSVFNTHDLSFVMAMVIRKINELVEAVNELGDKAIVPEDRNLYAMEKQDSVLTKITSYEAGEFQDSPIYQRESSFLYMKDKYEKVKVFGHSKLLGENVQSEAWLIQGVAVYAAVFSSGNAYWASGQQEKDNQSTGSKSRLPQVDVNNAPVFIERFTEGDQAWTIINDRPTQVEIISISNKPGEDEVEIELDYARKRVKIDTLFPTKEKLIESIFN